MHPKSRWRSDCRGCGLKISTRGITLVRLAAKLSMKFAEGSAPSLSSGSGSGAAAGPDATDPSQCFHCGTILFEQPVVGDLHSWRLPSNRGELQRLVCVDPATWLLTVVTLVDEKGTRAEGLPPRIVPLLLQVHVVAHHLVAPERSTPSRSAVTTLPSSRTSEKVRELRRSGGALPRWWPSHQSVGAVRAAYLLRSERSELLSPSSGPSR